MTAVKTRKSNKGPRTRELIFETAISLFQKQGYEQTTMRDIAGSCDVALGNAYYYFRSKEHLVFALYERTLEQQLAHSKNILAPHQSFKARLSALMSSNIQVLEPYHTVLRALFKLVADPDGVLSPFGPGSIEIRERSQSMFKDVVDGSNERMSASVRSELPYLLWLSYMGVVFYWLHDKSVGRAKTHKLISLLSDLFSHLVTVVSLPMMGRLWDLILRLVNELRL